MRGKGYDAKRVAHLIYWASRGDPNCQNELREHGGFLASLQLGGGGEGRSY
jgi:hypothetical protein